MKRILLSIDDETLRILNATAKKLGLSRSALIRYIVRKF